MPGERSTAVKLDEDLLRNDLRAYAEMVQRIGLPSSIGDVREVEQATDAELVDMAATEGWDLAKYVTLT